jgi:hypothetical protein
MNTYTKLSAKTCKSGQKNVKTSMEVEDNDLNHAKVELHVTMHSAENDASDIFDRNNRCQE